MENEEGIRKVWGEYEKNSEKQQKTVGNSRGINAKKLDFCLSILYICNADTVKVPLI